MPYDSNKHELEILDFWNKNNIFEKSVNQRPENKPFVFYDGPPFATGLPHYGHIVPGTIKDAMPRYKTMHGFRVERRWGWDCHGLPIENIVEKELDLPGKKEIEEYGIDKFNEACRSKVFTYADEWAKIMPRLGRWVDMKNDYKTMDKEYMESVWWVFSELWKKGFVYEGKKPMHICPRCATPLSNFEVTQGYKDVKDMSVTAKFKIHDTWDKIQVDGPLYMLAWTTTPWTLPGNVLLAVGENIDYAMVKHEDEYYIVAKELIMQVFEEKEYEVVEQIKGSDLVGITYESLFPYFTNLEGAENAFRVVTADFVTTEDGTGIVHLAPAFGTDDYEVFKKEGVPFIQHVTIDGRFIDEVKDFAGQEVKQKDDHMATDIEIVKWLAHNGKLFSKKKYEHSYPHCWRCDTPLLNYATSSWFIEVTKIKDQLLKNNEKINWVPEHIKEGRFGQWLEGVRDWAVSRNRYWGTPLPVWRCSSMSSEPASAMLRTGKQETRNNCEHIVVIGSVEELERYSNQHIDDLHKHFVDKVTFPCEKCGEEMKRVEEVFDCWFESGSMPYGQMHYPFENKEKFEKQFPADFIAEGADQTRGWFYTLHVLATALTTGDNPSIPKNKSTSAFQNVVVNGIVLAEDGKKMSKRLKNYPDPMDLVEKYGADALRLYILNSPVVVAESLNFSETGVREVYNKVCNTLWNVVSFYEMFEEEKTRRKKQETNLNPDHILDKWILAKLQLLICDVTKGMEEYKFTDASRPIQDFVLELSQWYVRRSRDRFKHGSEEDKQAAVTTLRHVLLELSKVMAPFTPFIAEKIWQTVNSKQGSVSSVHLEMWPEVDDNLISDKVISDKVISDMEVARKVVERVLSLRKEHGLKIRQPLLFVSSNYRFDPEIQKIIVEEVNVKEIKNIDNLTGKFPSLVEDRKDNFHILLNTEITPELKQEGLMREVVRAINQIRKEKKLSREHKVVVEYKTDDEELKDVLSAFADEIKMQVLADKLVEGEAGEDINLDGHSMSIVITKV